MSLIVKNMETHEILVMTKGADNIMLERIVMEEGLKEKTKEQLYRFACLGLRTLVMGQKELKEEFFEEWQKRFKKAQVMKDKDEKELALTNLFEEVEQDLEYLGSSAIEDLLQDEVPETIQSCLDAGIRLWVLTGDKQETAIEIGKSCNLINEQEMELQILSS